MPSVPENPILNGDVMGPSVDQPLPVSMIVDFWAKVFCALRPLTLFDLLGHMFGRRWLDSRKAVDVWTLVDLAVAIAVLTIASVWPLSPLDGLIVFYTIWQSAAVVVVQLNVILFDAYRARQRGDAYPPLDRRRLVVLALQNMAELTIWFAAAYTALGKAELQIGNSTAFDLLRNSFVALVSFGSTTIPFVGSTGHAVVGWQGIVGFLVTVVSLAAFVGFLSGSDDRSGGHEKPVP